MKKLSELLLCLLLLCVTVSAQKATHTFALGDKDFLLDGKPLLMISGEMHCNRIPKEYWRDRIKKAKAMGLNAIGTYIFWNVHEPQPGQYDFSGNNDVAEFVRIAKEEGVWVVMRPSPYVCAEWEFGGYPYWLQKDTSLKVRSQDPKFLKAYRNYINRLAKELVPLQVTNGGNILMIQIENEYGSYSNDVTYLDINRKIFQEAGLNVPLFTCDPMWALRNGVLPGYLPAVNGSSDPQAVKDSVNKYHDGKGPYYVAEWYPGWFDDWGKKHAHTDAAKDAANLDKLLAGGVSVNMYMFHGGTTRGFMNGANMNKKDPYSPQVSSYDYDAPLDEAGNPTEKFFAFRKVIEKYLPTGVSLPPIPEKNKSIAIKEIQFTGQANLWKNLPKPVLSAKALSFEDLNQPYGLVLYRTQLKKASKGWLKLPDLRDFATIYINGKHIATLDRRLKQDSVLFDVTGNDLTLDILVENNGRVNFGPYLTDNRKGLVNGATLDGVELKNWEMYSLPFNNVSTQQFTSLTNAQGPALYKGSFALTEIADTYLDMRGFGKGFVFLNGHNLGKYWQIGPQQTIYVPAGWLKKDRNEIVVFDALESGHKSISTLGSPVLDEVKRTTTSAKSIIEKGDVKHYVWNAGNPFVAAESNGRWGNLADWITSPNVKNHNSVGGWCSDLGGCLAMETGWDNSAPIVNGKLYQTFTLPAGTYIFDAQIGASQTSEPVYIVAASGESIPDAEKLSGALASTAFPNQKLQFTIKERQRVSIGFLASMTTGNQYWLVKAVKLKLLPENKPQNLRQNEASNKKKITSKSTI